MCLSVLAVVINMFSKWSLGFQTNSLENTKHLNVYNIVKFAYIDIMSIHNFNFVLTSLHVFICCPCFSNCNFCFTSFYPFQYTCHISHFYSCSSCLFELMFTIQILYFIVTVSNIYQCVTMHFDANISYGIMLQLFFSLYQCVYIYIAL